MDLVVAGTETKALFLNAGDGNFTEDASSELASTAYLTNCRRCQECQDCQGCHSDCTIIDGTLTGLLNSAGGTMLLADLDHDGDIDVAFLADFNFDRNPDLMSTPHMSVQLFWNQGGAQGGTQGSYVLDAGGAQAPGFVTASAGAPCSSMVAADFNGDEAIDVLLVCDRKLGTNVDSNVGNGTQTSLFLGNEDGTFTVADLSTGDPLPEIGQPLTASVFACDIDSDGDVDLAFGSNWGSTQNFAFYTNDGNAVFTEVTGHGMTAGHVVAVRFLNGSIKPIDR